MRWQWRFGCLSHVCAMCSAVIQIPPSLYWFKRPRLLVGKEIAQGRVASWAIALSESEFKPRLRDNKVLFWTFLSTHIVGDCGEAVVGALRCLLAWNSEYFYLLEHIPVRSPARAPSVTGDPLYDLVTKYPGISQTLLCFDLRHFTSNRCVSTYVSKPPFKNCVIIMYYQGTE